MINKLNPATKIPFVVNPVDDTQDPIIWIRQGQLLDGAESATTQEGSLNKTGTQIQENIVQLKENADLVHDKLNEVIDAVNDGTDSQEVVRIRAEIGPSSEAVEGETIYERLDKAEDIISSLEGGAVSLTDWEYNDGAAVGGEMSVVMPEGVAIVTDVHINGSYQYPDRGYEWDPATRILKLATFLRKGDELTAKISKTPGVPDSNSISNWVVYSWLYNEGSAVGGETTLPVSFAFYSVPAIYKNGARYYAGLADKSYTFDTTARTITLTEPLVQGDRVIVQLGGEARPADQDNYEGYEPWLYNNGSAVGGEKILTLTGVTKKIARVHVNGNLQYPPQTIACTVDQTAKTIAFVDELQEGDVVLVDLGTDPFSISFPDYTLQEVARAANVMDSDVILSSDPITKLDGKTIIYDYVSQKYWGIPEGIPAGSTVGNVNGNKLTYLPSGDVIELTSVESDSGISTKLYSTIITEPTTVIKLAPDVNAMSVRSIDIQGTFQYLGYHYGFNRETQEITLYNPITAAELEDADEGLLVVAYCDVTNNVNITELSSILSSNQGASFVKSTSGDSVQDLINQSLKSLTTFIKGGTLYSVSDLVYDGVSFYTWRGSFPKVIPANSSYTSTGGISSTTWGVIALGSANQLPWTRSKLADAVTSSGKMLDSVSVSIWEFANRITYKPTTDWQTWDWSPALQAMVDYCMTYTTAIGLNTMNLEIDAYVPGGLYPLYSKIVVQKQGTSGESLGSLVTLRGSGRTSTIFAPQGQGAIGIEVLAAGLNLYSLGFRAGAKGQTAIQYGHKTTWLPAAHCVTREVGTSGFCYGMRVMQAFDSSWYDIFIQSISDTLDGTLASGFVVETYEGLAGSGAPGSGDNSNQLLLVRPTIETASGVNVCLFTLNGLSGAYPHHAITLVGGHFESHNLTTQLYYMKNVFHISAYSTVMIQNGAIPTGSENKFYPLGYIENGLSVAFYSTRQGTTARLAEVGASDPKAFTISGTSQNVIFPNSIITGPYNNINAAKHRADYLFDYTLATKGKRAFSLMNTIIGDSTTRPVTTIHRLDDLSGVNNFTSEVNDAGGRSTYYSTNFLDTAIGTELEVLSNTGDYSVRGNVTLGYGKTTKESQNIGANGAQVLFDNTGRIYLTPPTGPSMVLSASLFVPSEDVNMSLGSVTRRFTTVFSARYMFTTTMGHLYGSGSPEGAVTASVGSIYSRTDGGAGTSVYFKETGTGNTGWVGK